MLDERETLDRLLSTLSTEGAEIKIFTLTAGEETLRERLMGDVEKGLREEDVIPCSLEKLPRYEKLRTEKINTDKMTARGVAEQIKMRFLRDNAEN